MACPGTKTDCCTRLGTRATHHSSTPRVTQQNNTTAYPAKHADGKMQQSCQDQIIGGGRIENASIHVITQSNNSRAQAMVAQARRRNRPHPCCKPPNRSNGRHGRSASTRAALCTAPGEMGYRSCRICRTACLCVDSVVPDRVSSLCSAAPPMPRQPWLHLRQIG